MKNDNKKIARLIKQIQHGNQSAFEEFYKLTSSRAYFLALKITQNEQDAEDILQESYIKVLEKINEIDISQNVTSWFLKIVSNKSKDLLKSKSRIVFEDEEETVFDEIPEEKAEFCPEENLNQEELRLEVMAAIDELTAEKAATCSQDGYVKSICGECGYAETEVIPETGHTSTGWIYHADNVLYKTCSVCGLVLERNALQWHVNEYKLELWRTHSYRFESYVYDNKGQIFPIKLNFTSSDENVVTVIRNSYNVAYFDAVGLGEATITVTIDGTDISRDIKITVVPAENCVEWWVDGKRLYYEWIAEGAPIPLPEPPVKEGYEFVGWTPEVPETMPYDLYDDLVFTAVFNKVTKAENFDVSASYAEGCFDEDVSLDVAEIQGDREPGGVYMVEGEYYKQIGFYNIKTVNENGNVLQPNEGCTVTIKMAIPDAYKNRTEFMIYHRFVDGGREQLSTGAGTIKVENGYLIFNVSKFSEFEIFAKADKSEIPDTPVDKVSPSIKITSLPVKTVYACGEDIDLTGIRVIYTNSNGEKKYVSNIKHLSVSGYNSKEVGKQTVTVKYGDCSDSFEVTVKYTFWQWIIKILTFGLFRF
mgnify:CR=1 FL=1